MLYKTITLEIDESLIQPINAKQNDNARYLHVYLTNNGDPLILTGCSVYMACQIPGETHPETTECEIIQADIGLFSAHLNQNVLNESGVITCEFVVKKGIKTLSTVPFQIQVHPSIWTGSLDTADFNLVDCIVSDVENMKTDVNRAVDLVSKCAKTTIRADIKTTTYKAGDVVDVDMLERLQTQLYHRFIWDLNNRARVTINCQGDSLTYGYDISSPDKRPAVPPNKSTRAGQTYPEAMAEYLNQVYGNRVSFINRGYSGDTTETSYNRWTEYEPAHLTIMMLGSNDAMKAKAPYTEDVLKFADNYEQLIIRELLWGRAMIMLKPPRTLWANDKRIEAYSNAIENIANKYSIPVLDTTILVSSHNTDIWSDKTASNTDLICKHFTTKGYRLIGAGVAAALMGESIVNAKRVGSDDVLLAREQVDGVTHIIGCSLTDNTYVAYTPQERYNGRSMNVKMDNGKLIYSFFAESEDLIVYPTVYCGANSTVKMTLDFNTIQPYPAMTTKYPGNGMNTQVISSVYEFTNGDSATMIRKDLYTSTNTLPLRIVRKGWHTIMIEASNAAFYGLEFGNYFEWTRRHDKMVVKKLAEFAHEIRLSEVYYEVIGRIACKITKTVELFPINDIPEGYTFLNKQATISGKDHCKLSIYTENDITYIKVSDAVVSDTIFVDYRLFGYKG